MPDEFKIKSLYNNDLILNIALKSKETVQKLKFLDSSEAKGKSLGLAEGSRQAKLETARNLRAMGLSNENSAQAIGLFQTAVAALK